MLRMAALIKTPAKSKIRSVIRFRHAKKEAYSRNSQRFFIFVFGNKWSTKCNEIALWMQKKRRGILTNGICLFHDNARSHAESSNQNTTQKIQVGIFRPTVVQSGPSTQWLPLISLPDMTILQGKTSKTMMRSNLMLKYSTKGGNVIQ